MVSSADIPPYMRTSFLRSNYHRRAGQVLPQSLLYPAQGGKNLGHNAHCSRTIWTQIGMKRGFSLTGGAHL